MDELVGLDEYRDANGFIRLKQSYSELYKKVNYRAKTPRVINKIYEYDIRAANLTMLELSGTINSAVADRLRALPKKDREVAIGKMIAKDKSIGKTIAKGIINAKHRLFRANKIQTDEVLSIKNDAVFISGRRLAVTTVAGVEFVLKHQYAMYQFLDGLELYYDRRKHSITIKGIRDEIVEHPDHQNGILQFLQTVFDYLLFDRMSDLREYLIDFAEKYKRKELPVQYYRELNLVNSYRTVIELSGFEYNLEEISDQDLWMINPVYNYMRFVLPIIQQYM